MNMWIFHLYYLGDHVSCSVNQVPFSLLKLFLNLTKDTSPSLSLNLCFYYCKGETFESFGLGHHKAFYKLQLIREKKGTKTQVSEELR